MAAVSFACTALVHLKLRTVFVGARVTADAKQLCFVCCVTCCRFNKGFDELVKQKHTDADRLSDLNTRVDELIRELVKIHLVLNPTVAAPAAANDAVAGADSAGRSSMAGVSAGSVGDGSAARESGNGGAAEGSADVQSAMQLTAELGHGRLVPFWSPEENLEDMLLKIQPGEIKVRTSCNVAVGLPAVLPGCPCNQQFRQLAQLYEQAACQT